MSNNVFVNGSIYNFGASSYKILKKELSKIKNPKYHWDDDGDLFIEEDFDMRHIEAILRARDIAWEEIHSPDFVSKDKLRKFIKEKRKKYPALLLFDEFEKELELCKKK